MFGWRNSENQLHLGKETLALVVMQLTMAHHLHRHRIPPPPACEHLAVRACTEPALHLHLAGVDLPAITYFLCGQRATRPGGCSRTAGRSRDSSKTLCSRLATGGFAAWRKSKVWVCATTARRHWEAAVAATAVPLRVGRRCLRRSWCSPSVRNDGADRTGQPSPSVLLARARHHLEHCV